MMALVVLDEEVPIANHGENDLGHPAVEGFLLVPEFVASIQRQPVDDPQGESESHYLPPRDRLRSEEHTSELQSLMRISYAVFCLKKKTQHQHLLKNS